MTDAVLSEDGFRKACGQFPTGVAVVTVMDGDDEVQGVTISSFTSVSLKPPLILFCLHSHSRVLPTLQARQHFCVNILASDHEEISSHFARKQSPAGVVPEWRRGIMGPHLLAGALAGLECRLEAIREGGDHAIVIGQVMATFIGSGAPLIRYGGAYHSLNLDLVR